MQLLIMFSGSLPPWHGAFSTCGWYVRYLQIQNNRGRQTRGFLQLEGWAGGLTTPFPKSQNDMTCYTDLGLRRIFGHNDPCYHVRHGAF